MNINRKKVVVTGGAGFIGSHIVDRLVMEGIEVVVIDNFSTGNRDNLFKSIDKVTLIEGSITDLELLKRVFQGAYAVLHQAALPSVPKSIAFPIETHETNSTGTLNVFIAAHEMGVDRVIYACSSSAYGNTTILPKIETMTADPLSPYAIQKYTGELYGKVFNSLYDLKTIGLRYFNVFGPRQNPDSEYSAVIPKFIKLMKRGEIPTIYGDGETTRDFTYVDNVVEANILALSVDRGFGEIFNVAAANRISLNDLIKNINKVLGTSIDPKYNSFRKGDVKDSYADISKAEKILKYKLIKDFGEGLKLTVDSIK